MSGSKINKIQTQVLNVQNKGLRGRQINVVADGGLGIY